MKKFYYDFGNATIDSGTVSTTTYSGAGDSVTNEDRVNDKNISLAITNYDTNDAIQFAYSENKSATAALGYFTATSGNTLQIYSSTSATDIGTSKGGLASGSGWKAAEFTATAGDYYYAHAQFGSITGCAEILIGKHLDMDGTNLYSPDIAGYEEREEFLNDISTSYSGVEYAKKRGNPKTVWKFTWSNISSTMKTNLEDLRDTITGDLNKFVYYDGTNYYWVRYVSGLDFKEVAYQRYSTSLTIREQLV